MESECALHRFLRDSCNGADLLYRFFKDFLLVLEVLGDKFFILRPIARFVQLSSLFVWGIFRQASICELLSPLPQLFGFDHAHQLHKLL